MTEPISPLDDAATVPDEPVVRLDHFLKIAGFVDTGGQAKLLIQGGEVLVNGELETRRRKQLRPGDRVQVGDNELEVPPADIDD